MGQFRIQVKPPWWLRPWRWFFPKEEPWREEEDATKVVERLPSVIKRDTTLYMRGDFVNFPDINLQVKNGVEFKIDSSANRR